MDVFIDIEFIRESQEIKSVGAVYGKSYFFQKIDKNNKNPSELLKKLYNFLPAKTECLFYFFGKEDVRILKTNRNKYEFPDVINSMIDNITSNSVDILSYLSPINVSLDTLLNEMELSVRKPLHNPLNDAVNLQTLHDGLKKKGSISRLIKIAKNYGKSKSDGLSQVFEKNLKNLFELRPSYKKNTTNIQNKIILINKENGHEYILNDISAEELEEKKFYKVKAPKIYLDYTGNKRECVIFILENIDSKTMTIDNLAKNMSENTGMNLSFCEDFIQELENKEYLFRISPSVYQLREHISFMDQSSQRRILIDKNLKNKICIIA